MYCADSDSSQLYSSRFLSSRSAERKIVIKKLQECSHFHYENVNLNSTNFEIHLVTRNNRKIRIWSRPLAISQSCSVENITESPSAFSLLVRSNGRTFWSLNRTYEDFKFLDKWLHKCSFNRATSKLKPFPPFCPKSEKVAIAMLDAYLHRFSSLFGNRINCCCILNWLQMDNKGNKLLVGVDDSPVNIPAKAAASAIRNYRSRALDELSFEVGSMISVIDMPPASESNWWRGKRVCAEKGGVEVGFFPSQYVRLIGQRQASEEYNLFNKGPEIKTVHHKHGKLITFLRTFFSSRPSRIALKQAGIVKERVFGCDLCEHLYSSKHAVPTVLVVCTQFIERYGIIDGIYRLNGSFTNIQKLRQLFDELPNVVIDEQIYRNDVHAVSSVLKMYFRELPIPILTFDLFDRFMNIGKNKCNFLKLSCDKHKIKSIRDIIKDLPPPNYRTLRFLMLHLNHMTKYDNLTNMNARNLAIVWAPNLLKSQCRDTNLSMTEANETELKFVQVVAHIAEHLILYSKDIFDNSQMSDTILTDSASDASDSQQAMKNIPYFPPKSINITQNIVKKIQPPVTLNCSIPNMLALDNRIMNCDLIVNYNTNNDYLHKSIHIDTHNFYQNTLLSPIENDEFSSYESEEECRTATFKASSLSLASAGQENSTYSLPCGSDRDSPERDEDIDQFIDNQFADLESLVEENQIYFNPPDLLRSSNNRKISKFDFTNISDIRSIEGTCQYKKYAPGRDFGIHRSLMNLPNATIIDNICQNDINWRQSLPVHLIQCLSKSDQQNPNNMDVKNNSKLKEKLNDLARRYSAEFKDEHYGEDSAPVFTESVSTFNLDHKPTRPCTVKERVRWLENNSAHFIDDDSRHRCTFRRGEVKRTSVRELLSRFEQKNSNIDNRNSYLSRMIAP